MDQINSLDHFNTNPVMGKKQEELAFMKKRIEASLNNNEVQQKVRTDFVYTFVQLGLGIVQANSLTEKVFQKLKGSQNLDVIEQGLFQDFKNEKMVSNGKEVSIIELLNQKLKDRAETIFNQIAPYLKDIKGKTIDFGAGDGQVTQYLHDRLGLDIEGYDISSYQASCVVVPIHKFDGAHINVGDKHYTTAIMTNVAHHEKDNQKIIDELTRTVSTRLVIVETVPIGNTAEEIELDKERTFMNDYLYNRLFHNADIPVPGTYETSEGWIKRFEEKGWKIQHSENFGFDQSIIRDAHQLLVFER